MNTTIKSLLFIIIGVALLIVGINMKYAQNTWDEVVTTEEAVTGTKGRNAAIGAAAGGVGGGVLAAVIGGVGIAACGTGIGMAAGLPLIALGAALGAGAGAVTGAAAGTSSGVIEHVSSATHSAPAYDEWLWITVTVIGALLLLYGVKLKRTSDEIKKQSVDVQADTAGRSENLPSL